MSEKTRQGAVTPWQLVKDRQYQQAIDLYSKLYSEDKRPSHVYGRGKTYLDRGNYIKALEDFILMTSIQDPNRVADAEYIYQGICYWYLDRPAQAVQAWRQSLTAPYTDAAGGVGAAALLLYRAERLKDTALRKEALNVLGNHARRNVREWPGPIAPFLLRRIDVTELEQRASAVPNFAGCRQCQADFYIALQAFREGDRPLFATRMNRCAKNQYGRLECEHYLARWEVQRQFPDPAFN